MGNRVDEVCAPCDALSTLVDILERRMGLGGWGWGRGGGGESNFPERLISQSFCLLLRSYDHAVDPESGAVDEVGGCRQVFSGAPKLVSQRCPNWPVLKFRNPIKCILFLLQDICFGYFCGSGRKQSEHV